MNLIEVKSSNIQAIGHDGQQTLFVRFIGGAVYEYKGVGKELYESFLNSDSKGRFFLANVKGKFEFKKQTN